MTAFARRRSFRSSATTATERDRGRARIKYLVHDWGVERFRNRVGGLRTRTTAGRRRLFEVTGCERTTSAGKAAGRWQMVYGISTSKNGRVKDEGGFRLRTALRTLVEKLQPELRVTAMQDLLFCNLPASARTEIEAVLTSHGVPLPGLVSGVRSYSLACPAVPTCGLAISESERVLPGLIDQIEAVIAPPGPARRNLERYAHDRLPQWSGPSLSERHWVGRPQR